MSSSSFLDWSCVSNCSLHILSSFGLNSYLELLSPSSFFTFTNLFISNLCLRLLSSVEPTFLSGADIFFCLQLSSPICLEFMSSSSFFRSSYPCVSNWRLHLLSSFEITFLSRIVFFIFFLQLNLPLYLQLMLSLFSWAHLLFLALMSSSSVFSWTCLCVSNCCLDFLSAFVLAFLYRNDVFLFYLQLKFTFCLVLMSSSSVIIWTCPCISMCCLHLLASVEFSFASRIDVFIIILQWILFCFSYWRLHLHLLLQLKFPMYFELMSSSSIFSWTYICISICCLNLLSSVELIFVSEIDVLIRFLRMILSLCLELMSSSSVVFFCL